MKIKEKIFFVYGMHCASCEVLIEKKVLKIKGVKFAQADTVKGELIIEYEGQEPKIDLLNSLFRKENYRFSEQQIKNQGKESPKSIIGALIIAGVLILIFYLLSRSGIGGFLNVNAKSSLPTFFVFGLIAGVSSCAALVGGIILSMSKQWADLYSVESSFAKKTSPLILFNLGRLISYALFGAILGLIGSKIALSFPFSSVLVLIIAIIMIILALQMLGIKYFRNFHFCPVVSP
ncbi:MAG: sulfite exporter TauE/SafE family protein [candidate division Zixibacteria bacterium]|nr:sulfite exporter TauE/SafE family protein [candidate division Zixibacteria bacterium]